MMTFRVCIFPCDNTVDIIRESWLCGYNDDLQELCKFPPVRGDRRKLQKLLLEQEEPDLLWQEYVIVSKRTGIESYSEAVRMLKIIQEDEDGVTTDPEQLGRGFRSPKRKRILSSSEEDNSQVTKAKSKKSEGRKKSREARSKAQNLCTSDLQDFKIPHCKSFRIPSPTISTSTRQSNSKAQNPTYATSTQKPFLSPLMDISNIYPTQNPSDQADKNKETGPLKKNVPQSRLNQRPVVGNRKDDGTLKNIVPQNRKPMNKPTAAANIGENQPCPNNVPQNGNPMNQRSAAGKIVSQNQNPMNHRPVVGNVVGNQSRTNNIPQNRNHRSAAANINGNRPRTNNVSQIQNMNQQPVTGNINGNKSRKNTVPLNSNPISQRPNPVNINNGRSPSNNIPRRNKSYQNQHTDLSMLMRRVEGKLDQVLEKVDLVTSATQRCSKKVTGVKLAVDSNVDVLKDLQLKMSSMAITDVCNLTDEVKQRFPVKSIAELKLLEDDLSDSNLRKKCVTYFSRLSTNCVNDSVRKIAKEMMTDELALKYSWTGRTQDSTGKLALIEYQMFISVLQESVRVTHDVTHEQVKKPFSRWLVLAKDRLRDQGYEDEVGEAVDCVDDTQDGNESNGEFGDNSQRYGFDSELDNEDQYYEVDETMENVDETQDGNVSNGEFANNSIEDNSQDLSFDFQNEEFDMNDDQDQHFNDDNTYFSGGE